MCVVDFGAVGSVEALVAPYGADAVFSPLERRYCARGAPRLDHWAGRLAAKRSVLSLLGADATDSALASVEIGVGAHEGTCRPSLCDRGHRPVVVLGPDLGRLAPAQSLGVSISHTSSRAVAVAVRGLSLRER